jgi:hypothetical protein
MDITAVVVLNETPPVTAVVAVDETTLQATVNPSPGETGGGGGGGDGGSDASLSNATPQPLGTAAAGTAATASRSDHRHAMPSAAQVGADPMGTAAAALAAHAAAPDPHPVYATQAEAAAAAPVQSVSLSAPSGWSASTTNTGGSVTLTLGLPTGSSLPSNSDQANWSTAYTQRLRWDGGAAGLVAATARSSLELAAVAASGAYGDLSGRPILGTAAATDASAYATAAQGTKADTAVQPAALTAKADLVGGVVLTSQIPAVAVVQYLGQAANQSAMLALRGQGGDWCIRTDTATEWVIVANDGGSLTDWIQLPTGIAPVSSINGQTGAVTLGTGDLSESGGNLFFTAARAIGAALTGFTAGAGTVAATDSILQAIQKVVGNIADRAVAGAISSSGLTMTTARILGRSTAGTGAPEEIGTSGGLVLVGGVLVPGEIVKLVVSDVGQTGISTGNFKSEVRLDRAFVVIGVWWNCHPTAMGSASTSDARPYIRTGAGTTSTGTKTNFLTSASNIASLAASVHTVDATSSIPGGAYSGSAGDWLGVDLMSLGTGSSGHMLTLVLRYS